MKIIIIVVEVNIPVHFHVDTHKNIIYILFIFIRIIHHNINNDGFKDSDDY